MEKRISARRLAELLVALPETQQPQAAYARIADGVRLLVSDGRVSAGTRLPSERSLMSTLAVSRTTVSRAYAELKERGYLTAMPGSGSLAAIPHARPPAGPLIGSPAANDSIDLAAAAPTAPTGLASAYAAALERLPALLQHTGYHPTGLPELRAALAARYTARGLPTDPEQIMVTAGASAALAVVNRALIAPGCVVLTESPTYPNAIAAFRACRARVIGADIDASSGSVVALCDFISSAKPDHAYLMPDYQNPTGLLLDNDARERLAATLRASQTIPVIDESMAELGLDELAERPAPFAAFHRDAILIGSASKEFWGGLRVGWIRAPRRYLNDFITARLSLDLGSAVVEQLAVVQLLSEGNTAGEERRATLRTSRGVLAAAVATQLPGWSFTIPGGGLSLWCKLPRPVSSRLVDAARLESLTLAAAPVFAPEGGLEGFLRLPYTHDPETITQGVERLTRAWNRLEQGRSTPREPTHGAAQLQLVP